MTDDANATQPVPNVPQEEDALVVATSDSTSVPPPAVPDDVHTPVKEENAQSVTVYSVQPVKQLLTGVPEQAPTPTPIVSDVLLQREDTNPQQFISPSPPVPVVGLKKDAVTATDDPKPRRESFTSGDRD